VPKYPHHITHRGNYKQIVFEDKDDFILYAKLMAKYSKKYGLIFLSYALMPNHVHFIAIPENRDSLAKIFNITQMVYAQYSNEKRAVSGHLWGDRFYSCILDPAHLYRAIRYVERNAFRAGLVKKPWDWEWSSAQEHAGGKKSLIPLANISEFVEISNWKDYLCEEDDNKYIEELRKHTKSGRPAGEKDFTEKIELVLNRKILPQKRGRPLKNR